MQPLRKMDDPTDAPVATAMPHTPGEITASGETVIVPVDADAARVGDHATSPALLLQEHLVARLAGGDAGVVREDKLPIAWRVVTIVLLSLGLWGGIALGVMKIITK